MSEKIPNPDTLSIEEMDRIISAYWIDRDPLLNKMTSKHSPQKAHPLSVRRGAAVYIVTHRERFPVKVVSDASEWLRQYQENLDVLRAT